MTRAVLKFELASFWHAGTGRGAGTELDALSHRAAGSRGLPVLPGRTVRGLLREGMRAAVALGAINDVNIEERLFGSSLEPSSGAEDIVAHFEETRFKTTPGALVFGSARVGRTLDEADAFEAWAAQDRTSDARIEHLFRAFASTKLNEHGVAQDHTLRAIELVVPLTLVAEVTTTPAAEDVPWSGALGVAARFVRGIGSHRNRGLGRVTTTLEVLS